MNLPFLPRFGLFFYTKLNFMRVYFLLFLSFCYFADMLAQQDSLKPREMEVSFENACQDTILVLVHYKRGEEEWVTKGWYWVPPGESRFVLTTPNAVLYYHARNIAGDRVWKSKENTWLYKEKPYGFRKITIDEGVWEYTKRLVCE